MAPSIIENDPVPQEQADYLPFPQYDGTRNGEAILNRHSSFITNEHDFPAARVVGAQSSCRQLAR